MLSIRMDSYGQHFVIARFFVCKIHSYRQNFTNARFFVCKIHSYGQHFVIARFFVCKIHSYGQNFANARFLSVRFISWTVGKRQSHSPVHKNESPVFPPPILQKNNYLGIAISHMKGYTFLRIKKRRSRSR